MSPDAAPEQIRRAAGRATKYLALATLGILYTLMVIGGYVSAAGLGLTCPDWPLCPGGLFPTEEYQVEWIHRVMAMSTGILVFATTAACWRARESVRWAHITSTAASVFVITQITLGALVIDQKLHAILVTIHFGIGLLLFASILLTAVFVFGLRRGA